MIKIKNKSKIETQQTQLDIPVALHSILVNMLKEVYKRANADGSAEIYNAEFIGTNIHQALPIEGAEKVISDVIKKYCA